ncbi:MAG: hypothetical protein WC679_01245 [Bacteroidales bacterium]|jgi:hypothetical protein
MITFEESLLFDKIKGTKGVYITRGPSETRKKLDYVKVKNSDVNIAVEYQIFSNGVLVGYIFAENQRVIGISKDRSRSTKESFKKIWYAVDTKRQQINKSGLESNTKAADYFK